ncbi:MAG: hypothetical protein ACI30W_03595 [Muribaculaceae bacterium]
MEKNVQRAERIEQHAAAAFGRGGALYAGFITGAIWADNNPDLSVWWHSVEEVPEDGSDVLLMDSNGVVVAKNVGVVRHYDALGLLGWAAYVANFDVKRWAYVSDLLPRDTFSTEKSE